MVIKKKRALVKDSVHFGLKLNMNNFVTTVLK